MVSGRPQLKISFVTNGETANTCVKTVSRVSFEWSTVKMAFSCLQEKMSKADRIKQIIIAIFLMLFSPFI